MKNTNQVITIQSTGNYYPVVCGNCGWFGSSNQCEGGGQIADTGDYSDILCPICFSDNVEECEKEIDFEFLKHCHELAINTLQIRSQRLYELEEKNFIKEAEEKMKNLIEYKEEFQEYRKFANIFNDAVIDVVTSAYYTNQTGEEYDRLVFDLIKQRGGFNFKKEVKENIDKNQEVIDGIKKVFQEFGNDKEKVLKFLKDAGILDIMGENILKDTDGPVMTGLILH